MFDYIDIKKIFPHPHNPRKDLGDLSELAESIKANGVLQNLTIVPRVEAGKSEDSNEDEYTAVIGHRRLAAAKLAGLEVVPCTIADMDEKTQLATMLLENMQRNDLTIWEQAQGFQMMLDLGETVDGIAQQTGLSQTTVRRRVKLLELDAEKFKEASARGASLLDYAELDKVSDPTLKNRVLESIGTPNFKYTLQRAIDEEKSKKAKEDLLAKLRKFAIQVEKAGKLKHVCWISYYNMGKFEVPEDIKTTKYFYIIGIHDIQLLRETRPGDAEKEDTWQEKERKRLEKLAPLEEINKRAFMLRVDFVKEYKGAKKHLRDIMAMAMDAMIFKDDIDEELLVDILGIDDIDEDTDVEDMIDAIRKAFKASPEHAIFAAAYSIMDGESLRYYDYYGKYRNNAALDCAYGWLEKLGYEASDEERALMSGTHELFSRSDDK